MKNIRNLTSNRVDNWSEMSNQHVAVPNSKLAFGSVVNKYPVVLDGGKTTIYISDESKESETRKRYEMQVSNRFMKYSKKPK